MHLLPCHFDEDKYILLDTAGDKEPCGTPETKRVINTQNQTVYCSKFNLTNEIAKRKIRLDDDDAVANRKWFYCFAEWGLWCCWA